MAPKIIGKSDKMNTKNNKDIKIQLLNIKNL